MKIYLFCAAGMSTSMLVAKMEQAAQEKSIACEISAYSVSEFDSGINECDVGLVAPQVRFKYPEFKLEAEALGKGCGLIDMMHYGMLNGDAVLQQAIELFELNNGVER